MYVVVGRLSTALVLSLFCVLPLLLLLPLMEQRYHRQSARTRFYVPPLT